MIVGSDGESSPLSYLLPLDGWVRVASEATQQLAG